MSTTNNKDEEKLIEVLRSDTMINEVVGQLEYYWRNPDAMQFPSWKIKILDDLMGGIQPIYFVLVAPQKFMKSFILQHIAKQTETAGKRNLSISLEMDEFMVGCRLLSRETNLPLSQISRARFTQEEWEKLIEAKAKIAEWGGFWNYDARKIPDLVKIIEYLEPDYIFWDYIGLGSSGRMGQKRTDEIETISRELKALTKPVTNKERVQAGFDMLRSLIERYTWLIGQDRREDWLQALQTAWDERSNKAQDDLITLRRRGLYTASQTSKEQQRSGQLDVTAPKGSQAPFEDCDLGFVGNFVLGADEKPLPNIRQLTVAVSRICAAGDEFRIGVNPSLAQVWDYDHPPEDLAAPISITDQFGRPARP